MNEKLLEKKLREGVKKLGGLALKFTSQTYTGMPDRIVLMPFNKTYWVEIKSTGKKLEPKQIAAFIKLAKLGSIVNVIDCEEDLTAFLKYISMIDTFCKLKP